jgi:hypothetical protein
MAEDNDMNEQSSNLAQRRAWFRYFPEGTLEFLLVTRVLALLLLAGLTLVRGSQRPAILFVLGALMLADYLLILWWGIQLVTDLDDLETPGSVDAAAARRTRLNTFLVAMLPAFFAMLFLTPFQEFTIADPMKRQHLASILKPILGAGYLILVFFAWRRLAAIRFGHNGWVILFFCPGLHLLALHRLAVRWQRRLDDRLQTARIRSDPAAGGTLLLCDITWVAGMLAVGLLVVMSGQDDAVWVNRLYKPAYLGTAALAAIFAIAQVALMENLQRRFLAALQVEPAQP